MQNRQRDTLSLFELQKQIKGTLQETFSVPIKIIAEISEIRVNSSNGHCYINLIEKREANDQIIAKASATIWSYTFRMLRPYFESTTGQSLASGMKILISAVVEYHELYGISLNIRDIDPTYTMGDMARRRMEIINQLEAEGILDMNKEFSLPVLTQRIAIISSSSAAGYQDFCEQIENNSYDFSFYLKLFPAVMQGNGAEESILNALEEIYDYSDFFDAVVIIRGGGATSDLACFDNYPIAAHIAQFPLPVIAGIGHERDESIVDLVAHTSVKTPTAAAAFLIDRMADAEGYLLLLEEKLIDQSEDIISEAKTYLKDLSYQLPNLVDIKISKQNSLINHHILQLEKSHKNFLHNHQIQLKQLSQNIEMETDHIIISDRNNLNQYKERLINAAERYIDRKSFDLKMAEKTIKLSDPQRILDRGFSITMKGSRIIKNISELKQGDSITTKVSDGSIESLVQ